MKEYQDYGNYWFIIGYLSPIYLVEKDQTWNDAAYGW